MARKDFHLINWYVVQWHENSEKQREEFDTLDEAMGFAEVKKAVDPNVSYWRESLRPDHM